MFLQRCFYVFIKWASTLSPFLETLPTTFLFLFRENVWLAVFTDSLFSLCAWSLKNNTSVEKKQHVILMKTTRRFCANNTSFFSLQETLSLSRSWPLSFFDGTTSPHKTSPHKEIFLCFSRKSYHKIWSIAKNTINLPRKVCRIAYWNTPFALNLED